jgi:hypothetical protein
MMSDETASNYIRDLGGLVGEIALQAKREYDDGRSSDEASYLLGRLMALHEIASLMQQQAAVFGLSLDDLSMEDLEPDRDLL